METNGSTHWIDKHSRIEQPQGQRTRREEEGTTRFLFSTFQTKNTLSLSLSHSYFLKFTLRHDESRPGPSTIKQQQHQYTIQAHLRPQTWRLQRLSLPMLHRCAGGFPRSMFLCRLGPFLQESLQAAAVPELPLLRRGWCPGSGAPARVLPLEPRFSQVLPRSSIGTGVFHPQ